MKVIVFGATGMVGQGVLIECLEDPAVESVLVVSRGPCGRTHPKLEEILHRDFFDFSSIADRLAGYDACFFCLGVSAAGMSEEKYSRITYDITVAAAKTILAQSPELTFVYVSGAGTDTAEKSRMMWARVKGRTENALLAMPFKRALMFRPGFIQPLKGVRTKVRVYRALYTVLSPMVPLLKRIAPGQVTTSERVGRAMIAAVGREHPSAYFENRDINALAAAR